MKQFYHVDAKSFADAASYFTSSKGNVTVMAGGTDLIGEIRDRVIEKNIIAPLQPDLIVNLKTIPNADFVTESGGALKMGALATLHAIETSSSVQKDFPLLAQAAHATATYQIRIMGTIAGNLCQDVRCWYYRNKLFTCLRKGGSTCYATAGQNSRMHSIFGGPAGCYATNQSDMACALLALNASIVTTQRTIPIASFYQSNGLGTVLKPGEIVTEVDVPAIAANTTQAYTKYQGYKSHGFGLVKVASALTMSGSTVTAAAIALGGVAPTPIRATAAEKAITGQTANDTNANAAAAAAMATAVPMTQNKWKVVVTQTLIARAISPTA